MAKPDKTSTDDLKRMLRRLERIEAEKSERVQTRGRGSVGARDIPTPPPPQRRSSIMAEETLDDLGRASPPRLPASLLPAAPELSSDVSPAVEAPREHQRNRAPVVIVAIAAVMVSTMTAAAVTFWLMGGLDRAPLNVATSSKSGDHSVSSDARAPREPGLEGLPEQSSGAGTSDASDTASSDAADMTPQASEPLPDVSASTQSNIAVPAEPAPELASTAPAAEPETSNSEQASDAVDASDILAEDRPFDVAVEAAPEDVTAPSPAFGVDAEASEAAAAIISDEEAVPEDPEEPEEPGASGTELNAADIGSTPESSVAALQLPTEAPTPDASVGEPLIPGSIKLISPESVAAEPGIPLLFPITIEANSSQLTGYYVVVSGLTRGSSFSSGIALLFDTWQISAKSLPGLELTAPSGFARRMKLKVELRGPQGETVTRAILMVELPGAARREAGLKELDANGVPPPSEEAQELIDKAEVFLDNGSLQAARMLLERAAAQGAGGAAMMLAASYDPQYASHYSTDHPHPDADHAKRWYKRAFELGLTVAASRLKSLAP